MEETSVEVPVEEAQKSKLGRRPKGNRMKRSVYMEVDTWRELEQMAATEGLPVTDVVARIVYEHLGHAVPAYCLPKSDVQEELPLMAS